MDQTEPEPPRLGPRPLPLHLASAMNGWISSRAGLPLLRNGSSGWRPEVVQSLAKLRAELAKNPPAENPQTSEPDDRFARAVDHEIHTRLADFSAGVHAYRTHPYRRSLPDPSTIWSDGSSRLLDYGPPDGKPVLFVPSLINRAYILDLSERRSLLRWMAAETGLRPLLLDWGTPGPAERRFSLTDYIAGRLDGALTRACTLASGPVSVVGYCMGGLLALALASRRASDISGLVLLATPWDFHAERMAQAEALARMVEATGPLLESSGELPVDIIQSMFTALDPFMVTRKFIGFSHMDPNSQAAHDFVALEDWLNDGVPLAGPVARECLTGWYGRNTPFRNEWEVNGVKIVPENITTPALVLVPQQDRIVPPGAALALAETLPNASHQTPQLGHIGMVAAKRAKTIVWKPVADWLHTV
jgi:polyhydroxyalkanoate synthase